MKRIEIYDTTLRDGAQTEGIGFSVEDKLRITEKLDELGAHYVEGGWPGSNPKDLEYFKKAKKLKLKTAKVVGLAAPTGRNIRYMMTLSLNHCSMRKSGSSLFSGRPGIST